MRINKFGLIIDEINDVQISQMKDGYIFFATEEGGVAHISVKALAKLHNDAVKLVKSKPTVEPNKSPFI